MSPLEQARDALTSARADLVVQFAAVERALAALDFHSETPDPTPAPPVVETVTVKPNVTPKAKTNGATRDAERRAKTSHDRAEVARIANEALAQGKPMSNAVAAALGITPNHASQLIMSARGAGFEIASPRGASDPIAREPFDPDKARMAAATDGIGY